MLASFLDSVSQILNTVVEESNHQIESNGGVPLKQTFDHLVLDLARKQAAGDWPIVF